MGIRKCSTHATGFGAVTTALTLLFLVLSCFWATRAQAIAAFSREYKTECTTCHTIFPQLNEFGEAFEKNGFIWPGAVPLSKKVKVAQTEEERKSAEFIHLSGIPATLPLSASLGVSYLYDDTKEDDFDQKFFSAQILSGGAFGGDRIGFWFNESLGNQDTTRTNSLSGPSQVYFIARHPLGIPVHLKAGRFSPDLSLWKTSLSGRLISMGANIDGFTVTGAQSGLELSSFLGPRVLAVVGVNDRNNSADAKNPHSVNDVYGRVGVKIGGADYHGKEPDVDLDKDSVWDYLSVSLSAFGYSGSSSKGDGVDHDVTRLGLEAGVNYKKLLLMFGATFGDNDQSAGWGVAADKDTELKSTALSAEVNYVFNAKYAAALRYDYLDVDGKDLRTIVTPAVIYAPLQSFKLRLSVAIDSNPTSAATDKAESNTTASLSATLSF